MNKLKIDDLVFVESECPICCNVKSNNKLVCDSCIKSMFYDQFKSIVNEIFNHPCQECGYQSIWEIFVNHYPQLKDEIYETI